MKRNTEYDRYIYKAVYAALTGIAFQLAFQLPKDIITQTVLLLISSVLYVVPFIVNVEIIKHYETNGIKPFLLKDTILVFLPAALASVITEMICGVLSNTEGELSGMGTFIFIGIGLFTMLAFWLAYLIFNLTYKKEE